LYDGQKEIDRFESLINPGIAIPPIITRLTGITSMMVADAPMFYEIARKIVELTEGAVFVAHNVRFDYNFLREEFGRLGYTFTRKQLCTKRLARNAIDGLRSTVLSH
jgi:DNA polymerase-3 subunit epsilon